MPGVSRNTTWTFSSVSTPWIAAPYVCGLSRSEEHTSELQSHHDLVCRLLLEKKKKARSIYHRPTTTIPMPEIAHSPNHLYPTTNNLRGSPLTLSVTQLYKPYH